MTKMTKIKEMSEIIDYQLKINELVVCRKCGWCCQKDNTDPAIGKDDAIRIFQYLKITHPSEFIKYIDKERSREKGFIILKTPCQFLNKDNICTIYNIRPSGCMIFPFYEEYILTDPCKKGREIFSYTKKWRDIYGIIWQELSPDQVEAPSFMKVFKREDLKPYKISGIPVFEPLPESVENYGSFYQYLERVIKRK